MIDLPRGRSIFENETAQARTATAGRSRMAVAACALVYVFLWRTKWGYEIRATGANPHAAEYGGISVKKQIVLAMAVSGGLAAGWPRGPVLSECMC